MYYYIYDEFVQHPKHEKDVMKIEHRLAELGMSGNIARLALFKRADEFIRHEMRRGITTLVVVGNDQTLMNLLEIIVEVGVPCGFVPLGTSQNVLANALGIPEGVSACDCISGRIVRSLDLGCINDKRFMSSVRIPTTNVEITCNGTYHLESTKIGDAELVNLVGYAPDSFSNPCDGQLDLFWRIQEQKFGFFRKPIPSRTVVPIRTATIRSRESITVVVDGKDMGGTRFDVSVDPGVLRMITGKGREF